MAYSDGWKNRVYKEEYWGDLGPTWTKEDKEKLKQAILKVRKLEGLD